MSPNPITVEVGNAHLVGFLLKSYLLVAPIIATVQMIKPIIATDTMVQRQYNSPRVFKGRGGLR